MNISIARMRGGKIIDEPLDLADFLKLRIEIDGQEFNVAGKDGAIEIHSTSGMRLLIELVAANWLRVREQA
mgnify:CR=1 FL=1